MDFTQLMHLTGLGLAFLVALGLTLGLGYLVAIAIQYLRTKYQDHARDALMARRQALSEKVRMREIEDKAKLEELSSKRKIAEVQGDLAKFTFAQDAEMDTLRTDATAKSKGILSKLDERLRAHLENAKAMEAQFHQERDSLIQQISQAQERLDEHRRTLDAAHDREQALTATNARLEQERNSLQEQVADLRSHLAAAETKRPLDTTLMNMAKSLDDALRGMQSLSTEVKTIRENQERF